MADPTSFPEVPRFRVVFVTGPSGAGRATAVSVLEDLGFEAIDNMPLNLVPRLLDGPELQRPLALGVDVRNRDFSPEGLLNRVNRLRQQEVATEVLYLDCRAEVLQRRYSETRRRHPLAPAETPQHGIEREFELLQLVRSQADILIDTSELTPHDLRTELSRWFAPGGAQRLALTLHSFSYKRGMPPGIDMVFDCRFLNNPHWVPELRSLDGRDEAVAQHVAEDSRYSPFFERVRDLAELLLPAYIEEGKAHLSIGFGCTGGQHRSVALAEALAGDLRTGGWQATVRHHELERRTKMKQINRPEAQV